LHRIQQKICPEIFIGVDKGSILGCQPELLEFENAWEGVLVLE
jgi:hypothetical protein